MATFTDTEIDEILTSSGMVIEEIITAEAKGKETVGRGAIPPSAAKTKIRAWEAHNNRTSPGNPAGPSHSHQEAEEDTPKGQSMETKRDGSPPFSPALELENPHNEGERGAGKEDATQPPSQGLLSMLDKIASKAAMKDPTKAQPSATEIGSGTKKGPDMIPRTKGEPRSIPPSHQNSGEALDRGTGGSTLSHGDQKGSSQSDGATLYALPSPQSRLDTGADAGSVPLCADFVRAMLGMMETLTTKVARLEYNLDLVLKHTSGMPVLKNDLQQVKTTLAVIEGNIGMMKIMDPGNATISSLNDLRATVQLRPVLVAGPGDPSPYVNNSQEIAINNLSQPVKDQTALAKALTPPAQDLTIEKEAVRAMINSRPMHPAAAKRLHDKLDAAATIDDIKKIKRLALNG
ncbi:phosphoprotein [avian paramyxovirus 12]|nr:phosphoprotein [Avian orthoavulavirus 12]